jgi:hypothetical protein
MPGVCTGLFAISLGASGGSLVSWRYDRGLWMLAGLFFLVWVGIYGLFIYGEVRDIVRGAPKPDLSLMIDFSLGTMFLSANLRFLFRVAKFNWTLSQDPGDA